eukprot:TRINITY_DN675_c0_g1_i4.p1 TRINITY_DN675_c0_g1~~TRINITY_DN675_c0_g1_i4.p1  ORF type:complete len:125 (+),score=31.07 TRINITY_DN675_c0_g1_i4:345-719(+)
MMELTISPLLALRALTALARLTLVWETTNSMSFGSNPDSSTASSSAAGSAVAAAFGASASGFFSPAETGTSLSSKVLALEERFCEARSSILASPKMMYVSDAGSLKTSGFVITKRICCNVLSKG